MPSASDGLACGEPSVAERIPSSLQAALTDLVSWLDEANVPSIIIGGVAASVLGQPRLTQDVDALAILPEADWTNVAAAAVRHGIAPRIENALEFARRSRVLLMRHVTSGIDIDLTFGGLSFEEMAVRNGETHEIGGLRIRLPRVEDLLIMKAVARRPKDLQDIEALLSTHPDADIAFVRRWVAEFAAALNMPDMLDELERMLGQHKPTP
jgi:hypothetical protein